MELKIKIHQNRNSVNCFLIPDVRYPDEAKLIKKLGGYVYKINAPNRSRKQVLEECKDDLEKVKQISLATQILKILVQDSIL